MTERTPAPEPGIYPDVPFDEYAAWDAVNHSTLKTAEVSLERYKHCRDTGGGVDSAARLEGRVLHAYLLEPAVAATRYVATPALRPDLVKCEDSEATIKATDNAGRAFIVATGRGKARRTWPVTLEPELDDEGWYMGGDLPSIPPGLVKVEMKPWTNAAKFCSHWCDELRAKGGEVIPHATLEMCKGMAGRMLEVPDVQELFDGADFETSIVWVDKPTGLTCKARLDAMKIGSVEINIPDVKSCFGSVGHDMFAWTVKKWSYASQAAFYIDGLRAALTAKGEPPDGLMSFVFLASEKTPPYTPALWELLDEYQDGLEVCRPGSEAWLSYGRALYRKWLGNVAQAMKHDFWPGYFSAPEQFPQRQELLVPSNLQLIVERNEV